MKRILILCLLLTSACTRTVVERPEPIVQTVVSKEPVVVPCKAREKVGERKTYVDTKEALDGAANIFERVKLLMAARAERIPREKLLEDTLDACK